jgi:hypothetical protein
VKTFFTIIKGTPSGRAKPVRPGPSWTRKRERIEACAKRCKGQARVGRVAGRSPTPGRRAAAPRRAGALRARRRRKVSTPAPAGKQSPPQRVPDYRDRKTGRAVLLAPGILSPRKTTDQGRTSSLRCGRSTLTLIFHGKTRHLSGGPKEQDCSVALNFRFPNPSASRWKFEMSCMQIHKKHYSALCQSYCQGVQQCPSVRRVGFCVKR